MFRGKGTFMAVAQMRSVPGDVRTNVGKMCDIISRAQILNAHTVVFPELATCGHPFGDRFEHDAFIRDIEHANEEIREASRSGHGMNVVWGSVHVDWNRVGEDGRVRKYNAALIASNGEWVSNGVLNGWIPMTSMHKYRIFNDTRHFYPAVRLAVEKNMQLEQILKPFHVPFGDDQCSLALALREDLLGEECLAEPTKICRGHHVDLLIDISGSLWTRGKWQSRERRLKAEADLSGLPILSVNAVGLSNDVKNLTWFDGGSTLIDKRGKIRWRGKSHREDMYLLSMRNYAEAHMSGPGSALPRCDDTEDTFNAIVQAMRSFFPKGKRVVIGLSGGIDSAVSAALLVEALGKEKVLAINMPTEYNSQTTQSLARQCAEALGIEYRVVTIQSLYLDRLSTLATSGYTNPPMLVKENIQARIRGQQLADIAACEDGWFVNNGNKTEIALNHFTTYGDATGAAAFLGDQWKGQIYDLARFINKLQNKEVIPQGIIDLVPSAELSEEQNVDEGKGDPIFYEYHDCLLRMFIEERWDVTVVVGRLLGGTLEHDIGCVEGVLRKYFSTPDEVIQNLEWVWKRYNMEFKRVQLPPLFVTSRHAFGSENGGTLAEAYFPNEYLRLKEVYLKLHNL